MSKRSALFLVALAVAAAAPAGADGIEGRFTLAVQGGLDSEISGTVLSPIDGSLFNLPVVVDQRSWRETYEPGRPGGPGQTRVQVLFGYGVTRSGEIIARGTHYQMESPGIEVGTVAGDPLFAFLDPYDEWGVEIGYRFYVSSQTRMKSYVAPVVGARFLDRVLMSLSAPDRGSAIYNLPQFDASTVAVFGVDLGFSIDLTDNFYLGLEALLRYQTRPTAGTTAPGLRGINDDGSRWSAPVVLTVGVRF
jgi:hypothetical protein